VNDFLSVYLFLQSEYYYHGWSGQESEYVEYVDDWDYSTPNYPFSRWDLLIAIAGRDGEGVWSTFLLFRDVVMVSLLVSPIMNTLISRDERGCYPNRKCIM
jgi:hypothetical protein